MATALANAPRRFLVKNSDTEMSRWRAPISESLGFTAQAWLDTCELFLG